MTLDVVPASHGHRGVPSVICGLKPNSTLCNRTLSFAHGSKSKMCFLIVSVTKSYLTHCDPMDCSPARLLCPWDFPRQEYWKVKATQSCPTLCDPMDCSPWDSPGQNTRTGSLSLLQGILPTRDRTQAPALQADSLPAEL